MFTIQIFNKDHKLIDELHEFSNLSYSYTLNGTPKCTFKAPLGHEKSTKENFKHFNHIEILEDGIKVWAGILIGVGFDNTDVVLNCFGYICLLKRLFRKRKTYRGTYDKVLSDMFLDIEKIHDTGLFLGELEISEIETTRVVDAEDYLLKKFTDYCDDLGYCLEVDNDRHINFYTRKGKSKPYVLQETKEYSNLILSPSITIDATELQNYVYGTVKIESEESKDEKYLTSEKSDMNSYMLYGLHEGTFKANDGVVRQSTLDKQTLTQLEKYRLPLNAINLSCIDSGLCPMADIEVGDTVQLYIEKYFNLKEDVRILEINRDCTNNEYKLVVGDLLYKPNKSINKKIYTK